MQTKLSPTEERAKIIARFQQVMAKKKVEYQIQKHDALKKKADELVKKKELTEKARNLLRN